jgi:adenylate kinase
MIILLGVAGSGKSTQGRLLADQKGYAWISTGEILRVLVTGRRRLEMLDGKLLTDAEMIKVMDKVLDLIDPTDQFVLDGFPRTAVQTSWILDQAKKGRIPPIVVLHLHSKQDVVKSRLMKRGRQDDTNKAISQRFDEYHKVTLPIVNDFKAHGIKVYDINASQNPEAVHEEIMRAINLAKE